MKTNKTLHLLSWIFVLLWTALIFAFSNQNGDSSSSISNGLSDIIVRIIYSDSEILFDGEQAFRLLQVNAVLRKLAHFSLYTILGLLLHFATSFNQLKPRWQSCAALLLGLLLSGLDEFHQYFIPGRTASLLDVGIDFSGVMLGCFLFWLLKQLKRVLSHKLPS